MWDNEQWFGVEKNTHGKRWSPVCNCESCQSDNSKASTQASEKIPENT